MKIRKCEICELSHPNRDCFRVGERLFVATGEQSNGTVVRSDFCGVLVKLDSDGEEVLCSPLMLEAERT